MSRGAAIEAGKAAVRFIGDRGPLQRALRLAEQDLRGFANTVGSIGRSLTAAAAATIGAFALPVRDALRLEEALSGLDAAFGKEAQAARGFMAELRKELGLSEKASADALTSFQRFFRGMGFSAGEARKLSTEMTQVAADLSAAGDISFDEASGRIRSALTGSTTVLDQFGINLKQSAIEAEALSRGINKSTGDLTSFERATINASLITQQFASNGILGAAKREADSASGSVRALWGQLADLSATIGSALIPVLQPLINDLRQVVVSASEWIAENEEVVRTAAKVAVGIGALGVAMQATGVAAKALAGGIALVRGALVLLEGSPIALAIAALAALGVAIAAVTVDAETWANITEKSTARVKDAISSVSIAFENLGVAKALKALKLEVQIFLLEIGQEFGAFGNLVSNTLSSSIEAVSELIEKVTGLVELRRALARLEARSSLNTDQDKVAQDLEAVTRLRIDALRAELSAIKNEAADAKRQAEEAAKPPEPKGTFTPLNEALAGVPDAVRNAKLSSVMKSIGRAISDDITGASELLKANVELAKGLGDRVKGQIEDIKTAVKRGEILNLEAQLAQLQGRTFQVEVASTFSAAAARQAFGIGSRTLDEQQLETQKEMRDLLRKIENKSFQFFFD